MAEGESSIEGFLDAADTRSTLAAVEALGARVEGADGVAAEIRIARRRAAGRDERGDRRRQRRHPAAAAARLARGPAGRDLGARRRRLDPAPAGRPDRRAAAADGRRRSAAARTACRRSRVEGAPLTGISYELPVASAQVKSCLLFAGLLAEGETRVVEPLPSRDHSERMLSAAGARRAPAGRRPSRSPPRERLEAGRIAVPGRLLLRRLLPGRRAARARQRRRP